MGIYRRCARPRGSTLPWWKPCHRSRGQWDRTGPTLWRERARRFQTTKRYQWHFSEGLSVQCRHRCASWLTRFYALIYPIIVTRLFKPLWDAQLVFYSSRVSVFKSAFKDLLHLWVVLFDCRIYQPLLDYCSYVQTCSVLQVDAGFWTGHWLKCWWSELRWSLRHGCVISGCAECARQHVWFDECW